MPIVSEIDGEVGGVGGGSRNTSSVLPSLVACSSPCLVPYRIWEENGGEGGYDEYNQSFLTFHR